MSEGDRVEVQIRNAELVSDKRLRILDRLAWLPVAPLLILPPISWALEPDWKIVLAALGLQLITAWVPLTFLLGAGVSWLGTTRRGTAAAVDDEGLTLQPDGEDQVTVPRRDLAMAWAIEHDRVEAFTHDGDQVRIHLVHAEDTGPLVTALRAATERDRAYVLPVEQRLLRMARKMTGWLVPLGFGSVALWLGWKIAPLFLLSLPLSWLWVKGSRRLRFGADGVEIRGRIKTRFVAYREVAKVERTTHMAAFHKVDLVLDDGSRVRAAGWLTDSRARLFEALLEEGRQMVRSGEAAGAHVPMLDRGQDDDASWEERVAAAALGGDYRGAALDPERLLSLMRNPAAEAEQRVAAALALREAPGGTARIRVAADVSTDPEVKGALEALAEEELDEPRLRRAIAELRR